jgi:hypothetical protein
MTAHVAPPPVVNLLAHAIEYTRAELWRTTSVCERVRIFWAAVAAARNLAASDVLRDEFLLLAVDSGLARDLPHADETIEHLIRWGLFARNPFGVDRHVG